MLDFCFYLLYRASFAAVAALPIRVLFALGNITGLGTWLVLGNYRRLALRNLEIAFGQEKSKRELRKIARRHFQRLGANLLCSIKLSLMSPEEMERCIETKN